MNGASIEKRLRKVSITMNKEKTEEIKMVKTGYPYIGINRQLKWCLKRKISGA